MLPEEVNKVILSIIESVDPNIFVIDLSLHRSNKSKLVLLIDTDEGIKLDTCSRISRLIGRYAEEEEVFDFAYTLEVSSPGLDRPLILLRQYKKNIGRSLKVTMKDGMLIKGELIEVKGEGIVIKPEKKKKKEKDPMNIEFSFEEIKEATVLISFRK